MQETTLTAPAATTHPTSTSTTDTVTRLTNVLTSTAAKKDLIKRALQKREWPDNTRFEVVEIPDLCWLLSL